MRAAESGGIFISYRRQESSDFAGRLYDHLARRFGDERLFLDVDTIGPGDDFAEAITRAVASSRVLLAVIGPTWLNATGQTGRRRLDDPDDFVRLEIEAALDADIRVIPILFGGAAMPTRDDLPASLAGLARRNALGIRHETFRSDAARLIAAIERIPGAAPDAAARTARLLAEAERLAHAVPVADVRWKARALSKVARALASVDPGRSALLFAEAERMATAIENDDDRAVAVGFVAQELATTDASRAERLARSVTGENTSGTRYGVARAMVTSEPHRAELLARSIGNAELRALAFTHLAQALPPSLRDLADRLLAEAEELARSPSIPAYSQPRDLALLATAHRDTDPDAAGRLFIDAENAARSISQDDWRGPALTDVASLVAAADPARADRLFSEAERIVASAQEPVRSDVGSSIAAVDPDRAERIARTLRDRSAQDFVRADIASTLAGTDPDRAERIARSVTTDPHRQATALTAVAHALIGSDPERAEAIAMSIPDVRWRAEALVALADPGRS